ncbi:zinc-ribbon domain-containing protein [Methanobrevibacter sp.]|uniref:zinc-ribbon domain-containing protein n=1 Tax=Methanobrevibacter sp. TaxID=66852 RepID=UPI0038656F12
MFCYKCGEENPDEAKFCKNCGALLKKEETVKKVEIVEAPRQQQNTYQQTTSSTSSSNNDGNSWISCCLCIVGIFIIFAIIGSL